MRFPRLLSLLGVLNVGRSLQVLAVPVLPETHEVPIWDVHVRCSEVNDLDLAYQVQVGQSVTAGCFGGYSAKMQDIGHKEVLRLERALARNSKSRRSC